MLRTVNGPVAVTAVVLKSGSAVTPLDELDAATMETSPAPACSVPASDAVVRMFSMSMATLPAMLSLPPPAPDFADAPSSWRDAMRAWIVAPFAVTVLSAGRIASLRMSALLIATATPMFTLPAPEGVTAPPSALADASVSAEVARVNRPPAITTTGPISVASDVVLVRLIATAAATFTPPALVEALGVWPGPVPAPPLPVDVVSAKLRSAAICWSTPLPAAPPDESPGAPDAEAFAVAALSDDPSAPSETEPEAASRLRARVDWLRWFAIVSASDTPTAASAPCASPSAVVAADAVWWALAENEPPMLSAMPVVTYA